MDEYCEVVQDFIYQEDKDKISLGFALHDFDGDGRISPKDVTEL